MPSTPAKTFTQPGATIHGDMVVLCVSLELSRSTWIVTSLAPGSDKMSKHRIEGGDHCGLLELMRRLQSKAAKRLGVPVRIVTILEAGFDGFWLDRLLEAEGIESHVVDPASVAVPRRRRRAKTDKIDGELLLRTLLAWLRGEPKVCSMVLPPSPEEEDRRWLSRERDILVRERTAHCNRIDALLATQNKTPGKLLLQLRSIGPEFASVLWLEGSYRHFDNRRQLAAFSGLAPSPWRSGRIDHEQGIAKSGNAKLRSTMIELAWLWLRYQPNSELSCWFRTRVQDNDTRRYRKITIVAMARKLLIALWRYVTAGIVPEGAVFKVG